jgi:hypothetical protein
LSRGDIKEQQPASLLLLRAKATTYALLIFDPRQGARGVIVVQPTTKTRADDQTLGDVMIRTRTIWAYSLSAALLLSTSGIANALCASDNPAGTWHIFLTQGRTPDIKSTAVTVRNSSNSGPVTIYTFPSVNAFNNNTSRVIKCVLTVNAAGTIAGSSPCSSYGVTGGGAHNTTVGGILALSSCNLTGTINVAGDPTPVSIVGGHSCTFVAKLQAYGITPTGRGC